MLYARRFDITKKADREYIEKDIIPVVLVNEAHLKAHPNDLPAMVDAARARAATAPLIQRKVAASVEVLPPTQKEVIFCGQRLWPLLDTEERSRTGYDYPTLCSAIWFFNDLSTALRQSPTCSSPASLALAIRHLLRFPHEWSLLRDEGTRADTTRLWNTIRQLSIIYERAQGQGTTQTPPPPIRVQNATPSLLVMPL
jgi:hypothetical protein